MHKLAVIVVEAHAVGHDDIVEDALQAGRCSRRAGLDAVDAEAELLADDVIGLAVGAQE